MTEPTAPYLFLPDDQEPLPNRQYALYTSDHGGDWYVGRWIDGHWVVEGITINEFQRNYFEAALLLPSVPEAVPE